MLTQFMNEPSQEQQHIINEIKNDKNVIVQAVAGSGKSTTVLSLAKQCTDKNILQVTYNSSLRLDIKEQIRSLDISNLEAHTYHSLAVKYYDKNAHTDTGIRNILYYNKNPLIKINEIDILVIDENQDISELYFRFILKFLLDHNDYIQLVFLGDIRQCIYEFKGADSRYLSFANKIWSNFIYLKNKEFSQCSLKTSYRITNQMGSFINQCLIGENIMNTCRSGEPVKYLRNNRPNMEKMIIFQIKKLLDSGVNPDEIFILAASIKGSNSNIRKIENKLVQSNIPCFVPVFDSEKLDERVIEGKIVFSTFHSVKGRQRNYVFVIGFDNGYFNFARNIEKDVCPNTIYVGASRGKKQLYLVEYDHFPSDRPFDFLKMTHHQMISCDFIDFKGIPGSIFHNHDEEFVGMNEKRYETASKIIQFIPEHVLNKITPILNDLFIVGSQPSFEINIPNIVATDYGFEDVSDLNGIAIPCLFYEKQTKNNILNKLLDQAIEEMNSGEHEFLKNTFDEIPEKCETMNDYLFMSNVLNSVQQKLYFKLKQIHRHQYNWLSFETIQMCIDRLEGVLNIDDAMEFEKQIIHHSFEEYHKKIDEILRPYFSDFFIRFTCIVDVISNNSLWEIKCTSSLSIEHKIQLVLYAWICEALGFSKKYYKLFNIKTGELYSLNMDFDKLTYVIVEFLTGKYEKHELENEKDFLKNNSDYVRTQCINHVLSKTDDFLDS